MLDVEWSVEGALLVVYSTLGRKLLWYPYDTGGPPTDDISKHQVTLFVALNPLALSWHSEHCTWSR